MRSVEHEDEEVEDGAETKGVLLGLFADGEPSGTVGTYRGMHGRYFRNFSRFSYFARSSASQR